jgi:Skp family chaperone for outer membrane proteins
MLRPKNFIAPVLILAIVAMIGCGGAGEEKTTLTKYFNASKMRDNLTLANIATVSFDPTTVGQVQSFSIVSSTPDATEPLTLKQLQADLKAAQDAETEFSKKKMEYQDANSEAIDRVLKAEAKAQTLKGKDAEIQKEWTKWRDETQVYAKKVSEMRKALNEKRPVVEISIQDPRNPVIVTDYDGEILSKDYTIKAKVKAPDGTSSEKNYVFTLQRAILKGVVGKDGKAGDLTGRWVITNYKDAA